MAEINNLEDIKTNFEKITNLINSMRAQGVLNFSGMDKVLSTINTKLDNLNLDENADLIKLLIGEVKTNIEERHGFVVAKFSEIETAINSLLKNNDESLKSTEIRKLFDVIATNLAVFSKEVVAQKDALTEITLRLEALRADDTQKNEIIKNISTLKFDITRINNGFESIILNINNNFKDLSSSFDRLAASNLTDKYGKSIEDIHTISNTILSAISMIDKKNEEFNDSINRLVTIGDFNESKELILNLITKNDEIRDSLDNTADKDSIAHLTNAINTSIGAINEVKAVIINNSDEKSKQLISQLEYLESVVRTSTENFDFKQFKTELLNVVNDIGNETNIVCNDLLETNQDLKRILTAVNLADFNSHLAKLSDSVNQVNNNLNDAIVNATERASIENKESLSTIINTFNAQINNVNDKLDTFKHEFSTFDKDNYNNIINNINHFTELSHGISLKIDNTTAKTIATLSDSISVLKNDISNINTNISADSKEIANELVDKLNSLLALSTDLKTELILLEENNTNRISNTINELSSSINLLSDKIQTSTNQIDSKFENKLINLDNELKSILSNLLENNNNNKVETLTNLSIAYNLLLTLSEDVKKLNTEIGGDLNSYISNVYDKINDLNTEMPTLIFQVTGKISEVSETIQSRLDRADEKLDKIESKIDYSELQQNTFEKIDAINSDIKFILSNLSMSISENNSAYMEQLNHINSGLNELSSTLHQNVCDSKNELSDKLTFISEVIDSIKNELFNNTKYNENNEYLKNKLENINGSIKSITQEINSNINENNDVWIEKLDNLANSIFETKSTIFSQMQNINEAIRDSLDVSVSGIKDNISNITNNFDKNSLEITDKLDSVSQEVKNVTDKLANYFINNDSDLVSKFNEISNKITISNNENNDKINNLQEKSDNMYKEFGNINDNIANKSDLINSNISTSAELLNEKIDTLSSDIKTITGDIVNNLIAENDRSNENTNNINNNINYTRDELINSINVSTNQVNSELGGIKSDINYLIDKSNSTETNDALKDSLNYSIQNIEASISEKLNDLCEKINKTSEDLSIQLQSNNVLENIESAKYEIKTLDEKLDKVSENISNNTNDKIEYVHTNINNTREQILDILQSNNQNISQIIDSINNSLSNNNESFNEKSEILTLNIKDSLSSLQYNLETAIIDLKDSNNSSDEKVISTIASIIDEINSLTQRLEVSSYNNKQEIIDNIRYISNTISTISDEYKLLLEDSINNVESKISLIPQKIDYSEQLILNKIEELKDIQFDKTSETFDSFKDIKQLIIEKVNSFHDNLNFKYEKFNEQIEQYFEFVNNSDTNRIQKLQLVIDLINENLESFSKIDAFISEKLSEKFNEIVPLFDNLSLLINENSLGANSDIISKIDLIESELKQVNDKQTIKNQELLQNVITILEEFKNYSEAKLNSTNSSINQVQIAHEDFLKQLENINNIITESFKNSSDLYLNNYESILSNINTIKDNIVSSNQDEQLSSINEAIKNLVQETSRISNKTLSVDYFDNLKTEIFNLQQELKDVIVNNSTNKCDFIINEIFKHIDNIYESLLQKFESQEFSLSTSIDLIKDKLDNANSKIYDIEKSFESIFNDNKTSLEEIKHDISTYSKDFQVLTSGISDLLNKQDSFELVKENSSTILNTLNSLESLINSSRIIQVEEIRKDIDSISNLLSINSNEIKDILNNSEDIDNLKCKSDNIIGRLTNLEESINTANISQIEEIRKEIDSISNLLSNNSNEIKDILNNSEDIDNLKCKADNIIGRLSAIEESINTTNVTQIEEIKAEFSNISNLLLNNAVEIKEILTNKDEFDNINNKIQLLLTEIKKVDSNLDQDITNQISIIKEEFVSLSTAVFTNTDRITNLAKDNLSKIEGKFEYLVSSISDFQNELKQDTSNTIEIIKTEFERFDALDNKLDKIDFTTTNNENADKLILSNIKSIEQKLETIGSNVNELTQNTLEQEVENIKAIIVEQKERINILSTVDDINEIPRIEDFSRVLNQNLINLLNDFNTKIDESSNKEIIVTLLSELKSDIISQTVKILDQISFEVEQGEIIDYIQEKSNNIDKSIEDLKSDLISKLNMQKDELLSNVALSQDLKSEIDNIHQKLDDLSDNYELNKGFENIHSKLDFIVDNSILKSFEDVQSRIDYVVDNTIEKGFEDVRSQIELVRDNTIKKEFDDVKNQLETVANNDDLQKEFAEVKKHLLTIQSGDSKVDYTYSLQDVESDIAKLRIAMKELQEVSTDEELEDIRKKVDDIVLLVGNIKNQIAQADMNEVSSSIEKMNEDIVSISTRTNKLLLTSENSSNLLKEHLESFRLVIDDLDVRTRELIERNDLSHIETSISKIERTLQDNKGYNSIVNQSLLSIAEWVDCAGSTLTSITKKLEKLDDIEDVKGMIRSIEMPTQFDYSVFNNIEEKFNEQQNRINSLEDKLNRLTELVEANDNSQITKKITSVDKQLAKLNKSIERLTSYVDEE